MKNIKFIIAVISMPSLVSSMAVLADGFASGRRNVFESVRWWCDKGWLSLKLLQSLLMGTPLLKLR